MSAIVRFWRRFEVIRNGLTHLAFGDTERPSSEFSATGQPTSTRRWVIAAGDTVTVWKWATDGDFTFMEINSGGLVQMAVNVDAYNTNTFAPLGTSSNWPKEYLSCCLPRYFNSMYAPVNVSAANYAGSAFHANTVQGRMYEVVIKNPNTVAVTVDVTWCK
jgi:hypothetical protein